MNWKLSDTELQEGVGEHQYQNRVGTIQSKEYNQSGTQDKTKRRHPEANSHGNYR